MPRPKKSPAPPVPAVQAPPPAVLKLQEQVVELVAQRNDSRTRLNEAHGRYFLAQSQFQSAESEMKGLEQEIQYRIGLIAQLENRQPANVVPFPEVPFAPPSNLGGISSEPTAPRSRQAYAEGSADDLRRNIMRGNPM